MEDKPNNVVSKEGLNKIQAVTKDGAISGAVRSLAIWGIINTGMWIILGAGDRNFLDQLTDDPSAAIYLLSYGSLIIGAIMLVFSIIGLISRSSATLFFDGFSLLCVGAWNVVHDFVAAAALKPYGYHVEKPNTIWIIFGAAQVVWGARQITSFSRVAKLKPEQLEKNEFNEVKKQLQKFVALEENINENIIKASITKNGPFGMSFLSETTQYTGKMLNDVLLMISTGLNDSFAANKSSLGISSFSESGRLTLEGEGGARNLDLGSVSQIYLKNWCGVPINSADIRRLAIEKRASIELLKPYLKAKDTALVSQTVMTLLAINTPEAKELAISALDDTSDFVKATAIDVCRQMKIDFQKEKMLTFLNNPDSSVRIAALKYLTEYPYSGGKQAIERLDETETVPEVKKGIAKALKAINRKK